MKDQHVLITGHTGFKGSWLTAMLHMQGAKVSGIALDPPTGGIFELAELNKLLEHDIRQDIREGEALIRILKDISPDVVIHLAAQPLVLASYAKPVETYETNVMGTLNLLQAVEATPSVKAALIVTTDKVYRQGLGANKPFIETDPLGAADPYSTSKAMADLMTQSWIVSHPESRIAIARAGNVIGGGDVGEHRLIPDLVKAFSQGNIAKVRNPASVRPWQHVLDCLNGYLGLTRGLLEGNASPSEYNFGPELASPIPVERVADIGADSWGEGVGWEVAETQEKKEALYLALNSKKAKTILGWQNILTHEEAIRWSVEWSKRQISGQSAMDILNEQIKEFFTRQTISKHE